MNYKICCVSVSAVCLTALSTSAEITELENLEGKKIAVRHLSFSSPDTIKFKKKGDYRTFEMPLNKLKPEVAESLKEAERKAMKWDFEVVSLANKKNKEGKYKSYYYGTRYDYIDTLKKFSLKINTHSFIPLNFEIEIFSIYTDPVFSYDRPYAKLLTVESMQSNRSQAGEFEFSDTSGRRYYNKEYNKLNFIVYVTNTDSGEKRTWASNLALKEDFENGVIRIKAN